MFSPPYPFAVRLLLLCGLAFASLEANAAEPKWEDRLQSGIWTPVHRMQPQDPVTFLLQSHGGSAFDTRRGRILLFGSDTHGQDWSNSPLIFDLKSLLWRRVYPDDPPESYRVTASGLPVAGPGAAHSGGARPWAMHSFGAVDYLPERDAVLVSSHPAHMEPGRFSDALEEPWLQVRRHPTWLFDLAEECWSPLPLAETSFFAYATAYDSDRGIMIGAGHHGVFELPDLDARWEKKADGKAIGYHNNAVYDSHHNAIVIFGRNGLGDDVLVYRPKDSRLIRMPTPGERPPKDEHAPMAYHPTLAETLVLVDRFEPGTSRRNRANGQAETWAYDLEEDSWRRIPSANLPFALGMNYHLHYDPQRDLLLLVTASPLKGLSSAVPNDDLPDARRSQFPEVWALRLPER